MDLSQGVQRGESADRGLIEGAKSMAATIADLWSDPGLLAAATAEFEASRDSEVGAGSGSADREA